jgi:hypothetical protein
MGQTEAATQASKYTKPVIAKYERTGGDEVQARLEPYKNREYFSIRQWYLDDKDKQLKPGRNGFNLPVDEAPEFLRLVVALFPDKVQLVKEEE